MHIKLAVSGKFYSVIYTSEKFLNMRKYIREKMTNNLEPTIYLIFFSISVARFIYINISWLLEEYSIVI